MYVAKEKNHYSERYKKVLVFRPEIGPKHFHKLRPNRKSRPHLQLCLMYSGRRKLRSSHNGRSIDAQNYQAVKIWFRVL